MKANKLWQKETKIDQKIEQFTIGKDRELDLLLAKYDVLGSLAHIFMLTEIKLLTPDELESLENGLRQIHKEIEEGSFTIEEGVEDVHSQVELLLTQRLGEVGKKIHSGRSRNDQVLLDLKLFIRHNIIALADKVNVLTEKLLELSEQYKEVLMPGYTHMQIAMPSSFGLWFGAYAESLVDDLCLLKPTLDLSNRNPLGSAAGYGSSFPLRRKLTTELLGFEDLNYNVVYAQMGRGKTEKVVAQGISNIAETIGKMAMDVCQYMGQNFGFFSFPDHLTTGSSIMPHKKNPDVFELIRARCNQLRSLPNEIAMIITNLPMGYHRDLQLIKENFLPAFATINDVVEIASYMLSNIQVNQKILDDEKYGYLFSVEVVNDLVLKGVPFREAYKVVGEQIEQGTFKPASKVSHTHEGSIGNLGNEHIQKRLNAIMETFSLSKKSIDDAYSKLLSF